MKKKYLVAYCLIILSVGLLCGINSKSILTYTKPEVPSNEYSNNSKININEGLNFIKELQNFLLTLNSNMSVDKVKIAIAQKVYFLANTKDSKVTDYIASELLKSLNKDFKDTKSLLMSISSDLTNIIAKLKSGIDNLILDYDATVQITSSTAALNTEAGSNYSVKLNGYIYYAEGTSTKWVVLLHGYMMNGKLIAQSLAQMYLDQGYNVLAPDLRGFGKSKGSVAMGYLESLDTWDWLGYINNSNNKYIGNRKASKVIIHGVSLGGATTLQSWSQANFGRDLTTRNVIGVVDDCGYDSMTGIINGMTSSGLGSELLKTITGKDSLTEIVGKDNMRNILLNVIKVGIKENEFDLKQDVFYSGNLGTRKMSNVPLYIIHGTVDTTVPFSISKNIVSVKANQAGLLYKFWEVSNMPHAFIVVGVQKDSYQSNLANFITYAENRMNINNSNNNGSSNNNNSNNNSSNNNKTESKDEDKTSSSEKPEDKNEIKPNNNFVKKIVEDIKKALKKIFG